MNRSIILAAVIISAAILLNGFLERRAHVATLSVGARPAVPSSGQAIAVLPFTSLSSEDANKTFTAGVEREIVTQLTVRHVKAASTSEPPSTGALLLGSVQHAGNRVRVNVQLVDAASKVPWWAKSYDRELTDVFALETEIAEEVAKAIASQKT